MKAELIDMMGTDLSVVNAARVSFDKESKWEVREYTCGDRCCYEYEEYLSEADQKLIKYLAKHNHWTPFAHTAIQLRMSAPVPIRTQCFKHKQGLVENEESRRYISSRPELYVPEYFRSKPEGSIKQGSGDKHPQSGEWKEMYINNCYDQIDLYEAMIRNDICPEQARLVLPQGCIVNWIWTGNLYSFANFYNKRTDPHAQAEIQELAKLVGEQIEPLFPHSWKALTT
jgi:thymidylate synthase (FAD)